MKKQNKAAVTLKQRHLLLQVGTLLALLKAFGDPSPPNESKFIPESSLALAQLC